MLEQLIEQSTTNRIDAISRGQGSGAEQFNFSDAELSVDLRPMTIDEQIAVINEINEGIVELEPRLDALFETKQKLGL